MRFLPSLQVISDKYMQSFFFRGAVFPTSLKKCRLLSVKAVTMFYAQKCKSGFTYGI